MQCTSKTTVIPLPKPNSFAGLMELYESNYIKIKKLCNNIKALDYHLVSEIDGGMDLHLLIIERTKYTTTINLSYCFSRHEDHHEGADHYPNVTVRIYFDAMQAEVLHRVSKPRARSSHSMSSSRPNWLCNKWADNRFLFKWLSYCLYQGHQFGVKNNRN